MKAWQGKLVRSKADLISVVKKSEKGSWKEGPGLKEEALKKWRGEQLSRMSKTEEGLDPKGLPSGSWQKRNKEVQKGYKRTGYKRNGDKKRREGLSNK